MSYAPDYDPINSFADDETNQASGRSTVRTSQLDANLADVAAAHNALNSNVKKIQRDDDKLRDMLVEPYALAEQTRAMLVAAGKVIRGAWQIFTNYAVGDLVQRNAVAYVCQTAHNSGPAFNLGFWIAISGDGQAAAYAEQAQISATTATAAAAAAGVSAGTATAAAAAALVSQTAAAASALAAQNAANSIAGLAPVNLSAYMLTFLATASATAAVTALGLNASTGAAQVGFQQSGAGTVLRTLEAELRDSVSIKQYGAVGTPNPANAAADTAAILAAVATGKRARIPAGTYYLNQSITVGAYKSLVGDGPGCVTIIYTGTAHAFLVGSPGPAITLTYNCVLGGFTLNCTNRASTVRGIIMSNAVYSDVFDIVSIGSGSPNSATPADWVLYGYGLEVTNNSILSRIRNVNCRIWNYGAYFYTSSASTSNWAAALEVTGCEWSNNMTNLVLGDATVGFTNAPGINFRGCWLQGGFTRGCTINSAQSVLFSGCYWEGNANYDVVVGGAVNLPVEVVFDVCYMDGENIGATNYGTFPYLSKVRVITGEGITLRNCDLAITASIPLVINDLGSQTKIYDCRLNSGISNLLRISILGGSVQTHGNNPERPRMAAGSLIRNAATANGTVVYSGVGFAPTSLTFRATIIGFGPPAPYSLGDAGLGNGVLNCCHYTLSNGAVGQSSTHCIEIQISAGNGIRGQLTTTGNGTFSIAWTQFGVPGANDIAVQWVATRDD